ncbi:MAG: hypothetical protein LBK99_18560 [Opitutaceae bacterium]|jgi:hypothetical protein|nr:hypothetical protein [Opitutaceae bacterium]
MNVNENLPDRSSRVSRASRVSRSSLLRLFGPAAGIVLTLAVAVLLWSRDEGPGNLPAPVLAPLALDPSENAFARILDASRLIPAELVNPDVKKIEFMALDLVRDVELENRLVAAGRPAVPLLDRALRCVASQAPQSISPGSIGDVQSLRFLEKALQVQALALARGGRADEAIDLALLLAGAGRRLEESGGNTVFWSTGNAFLDAGARVVGLVASRYAPSDEALRRALVVLPSLRTDPATLAFAMRCEYAAFVRHVEAAGKKRAAPAGASFWQRVSAGVGNFPLFFKPRQTGDLFLAYLGQSLLLIDLPVSSRTGAPIHPRHDPRLGQRHRLNPENSVGIGLLSVVTPPWPSLLTSRLCEQSQLSLTGAVVALRLYHNRHGVLPDSLGALVPEWLPSVPRDYVDGEPLRYSREFRSVWSTGREAFVVRSVGGDVDPYEIFTRLEFAGPRARVAE